MIEIENDLAKSIINVLFDYVFAVLRFDDFLDYFLFPIIIIVTLFLLFYTFKIIVYVLKEINELFESAAIAALQLFLIVGALGVGLVVIVYGIENFSINKTTKFISNLFSKDDKINISYINSKSNNKGLYEIEEVQSINKSLYEIEEIEEIEEVEEVKSIFDDSYEDNSYDSVFETDVGLIHCPDGINEICHDDYGKEYDKHGPLYFVRIDNGKFITIFEQVE